MAVPHRILFIDDDKKLCATMKALLAREGYHVDIANTGNGGLHKLNESAYDLVIINMIMPDVSGIEIVLYLRDFLPDTLAIVIAQHATLEGAISAMRKGAYDYLTKPIDFDLLKISIERALERVRLTRTIKQYTVELEKRVQEKTRELQLAQAQLIRSERLAAVGELAAHVAHEIRNPLISIGGLIRVLQQKAHKVEKTRQLAAIVQQEVERLERILQDLLDLRQDRPMRYKTLSLHKLLKDTVTLLSQELQEASVTVHWDLCRDMPRIPADEDRLKQILVNLCTNAIQAMPGGGDLTLRTHVSQDFAILAISDTGAGIAPARLNRIFTPFYTTKKKGTGLGLAICEKLVRDHGGHIEATSRPGEGTTFRIELPLAV